MPIVRYFSNTHSLIRARSTRVPSSSRILELPRKCRGVSNRHTPPRATNITSFALPTSPPCCSAIPAVQLRPLPEDPALLPLILRAPRPEHQLFPGALLAPTSAWPANSASRTGDNTQPIVSPPDCRSGREPFRSRHTLRGYILAAPNPTHGVMVA